jgi:hypothetical protein
MVTYKIIIPIIWWVYVILSTNAFYNALADLNIFNSKYR